jgi:hypothetical protein
METIFARANTARATKLRLDQTKNPRGGWSSGFWARDFAEEFSSGNS